MNCRALSLLVFLVPNAVRAQEARPVVIRPDSLQWADVKGVPGAQSISLVGGGQKSGVYAARVRLAGGARILPHTHPDTRYSEVISGTLYVGFGERFDETKLVAVPAGMLYVAPARQPHFLWAKDGEVIYQESGTNPTGIDFIRQNTRAEPER